MDTRQPVVLYAPSAEHPRLTLGIVASLRTVPNTVGEWPTREPADCCVVIPRHPSDSQSPVVPTISSWIAVATLWGRLLVDEGIRGMRTCAHRETTMRGIRLQGSDEDGALPGMNLLNTSEVCPRFVRAGSAGSVRQGNGHSLRRNLIIPPSISDTITSFSPF